MSERGRILAAILSGGLLVSAARGDGGFFWKEGADLREPSQKAIIYHAGGAEVLILQVKYEGRAADFAWIVPLPARPKVTAIQADKSPFAEISRYTQARQFGGKRGGGGAAPPVAVLERKRVGVYDVALLTASDPNALGKWLNENGYAFPAERTDLLEHYTRKKWVYTAMRIAPDELRNDAVSKLKTGELQPVRFEFDTQEMVYPLKISSVNAGETELLLYVLADVPMVVKGGASDGKFTMEENLVSSVNSRAIAYMDPNYGTYGKTGKGELPLTWEALGLGDETRLHVCRYRSVYTSEEMIDDIVFDAFEVTAYFRKRLSRWRSSDRATEQARWVAFGVLACRDSSLFEEFAKDADVTNRRLAAMHPMIPRQVQLSLEADDNLEVRQALVANRNLSADVLRHLIKDESSLVREAVASHEAVTIEMLEMLSNDSDESVRSCVIRNKRTPARLLKRLAQDQDDIVRSAAMAKLRFRAIAWRKRWVPVLVGAAVVASVLVLAGLVWIVTSTKTMPAVHLSSASADDGGLNLRDCPHCRTKGVLAMADGRCPNCKHPL